MNVRMTPPQGPMGQPMPMGGAPAPMPPMGGPMPVPPMQPTAGQQQKQGLGSAFGGSAQGRGQFKNFMSAKKQTSALVPPMQASMQPMGSAPPMAQPRMAPQPMLPGPAPQMMGAMKPMGAPQMSGPVQAGRPMRGTQGGLGSAPVQLNMGGVVPQLSMGMAASGPAVYLGDERLSDPADMHQKMLRAGYGRDEIMDSASGIRDAAMHIVEDTDEYLGGARGGFGHVHEFANGGEVPRSTTIAGQPHYLAYINPEEGELLKGLGGAGKPGPGGIPSYWFHSGWGGGGSSSSSSNDDDDKPASDPVSNWLSDTWAEITSGGTAVTDTYNSGDNDNVTYAPTDTSVDFSLPGSDDPVATIDYGSTGTPTNVTYYDDDDDDDPVVTTTTTTTPTYTDTSSIAGISDASGFNVTGPTATTDEIMDAYNALDADEEEDYNLGTGTDYSTAYDPFPDDDDPEPAVVTGSSGYPSLDATAGVNTNTSDTTGGYDAVGTGSVDDPAVGGGTDYSILGPDPEEDDNLGTGTDYNEPYNPPADEPPAPPPVYYDMFGGEHSTQEAANEADAAYTAAANAVDIVTGASDGTPGYFVGDVEYQGPDFDPGPSQEEIDASNNTAKLMNDYSAISNDYSTFQGNDLTKGSGNTIGYATGGSKVGYAAVINPVTGGIDILTPGSESVEASFAAEELEDALNYLTDGDVDLTNLDAPLDLIPEASGGTGTVGLDAEGRLIEYGVDDIEEMLSALEGMSDMTDEELAAIAGDTSIETDFEVFPTVDGTVTRDEIEADLAARDAVSNIVDPEEDFNLFPVDIRDDEEDTNLFPVDIRDDEEDTDLFPASTIDYGGRDPMRDQAPDYTSTITDTIKAFEGFSDSTYYDVNAERAGYGSDTKTDPVTGEVTNIEPGMTVTREEAEADLNRRLTTEFIPSVVDAVGADTFYAMDPATQAALTSIAYNYGTGWAEKLPTLANAAKTGDKEQIADAIADRAGDNDGVNESRRLAEAEMVRSGTTVDSNIVSTVQGSVDTSPVIPATEIAEIQSQLEEQIPNNLLEKFLSFAAYAVPIVGSTIAKDLRERGPAEREALVQQHVDAIQNGATPKYDDEGRYLGYDISTMGTFADKVLAADDIGVFLPPTDDMTEEEIARLADADGDGQIDAERLEELFDVQSIAAEQDPYGMSTEDGFIVTGVDDQGNKTETEYVVNTGGGVDQVGQKFDSDGDGQVDTDVEGEDTDTFVEFERDGGDEVEDIFGLNEEEEETGSDDPIDPCPEGFMLDPVLGECVPIDDVTSGSPSLTLQEINRDTGGGTGGGGDTTPVVGDPLIIRAPQQFARGGAVTPNIDRFMQSLGA